MKSKLGGGEPFAFPVRCNIFKGCCVFSSDQHLVKRQEPQGSPTLVPTSSAN